MSRRSSFIFTLVTMALVAGPGLAFARSGTTLYLGGGATGTTSTSSPFRGGWGTGATLEIPATRVADFIVRADYHVIPRGAGIVSPIVGPALGGSLFGPWPEGAARSTIYGVLTGLRVHAPAQRSGVYLDLLVGVGHARFRADAVGGPIGVLESRDTDDTNVALSLGSGVKLNSLGPGTTFLDAHFEFYFVGDREGALIPIRLGYGIPI